MGKKPSAPATVKDIEQLAELIGSRYDQVESRIADLEEHMRQWKADILEQFQFTVDEIRREMRGANRDEIQSLKDRLCNVEILLRRMVA